MKWEYKVVMFTDSMHRTDAQLNELGAEGWELVAIAYDRTESGRYLDAVFKRPKSN